MIFLKYASFIRRVPLEHVIPADEYNNEEEETNQEDEENSRRLDDDKFDNVEIVVKKEKEIEELTKSLDDKAKIIEKLEQKISQNEKLNKKPEILNFPNHHQSITFKEKGNDDVLCGKVMYKHKKSSIHKNILSIKFDNGTVKDYDFSKDVDEWSDSRKIESEEILVPCCLYSMSEETSHECYLTILSKAQYQNKPGVDKAMEDEIRKFEKFDAFQTVDDNGQYAIRTRWVVTEHEDTSKGYNLKTRLCMRGDKERDIENVRTDAPTAHKDTFKLTLSIAANEGFDITSADVKSAFLQGRILYRNVFVIPPVEANQKGKLWLLNKAAYGLIDGSHMFYLQLKNKLEKAGMKEVSGNSALYTMHSKGKLIGLVCSHVDDLFMAGNNNFRKMISEQILLYSLLSKTENNHDKIY